MDNAELKPCPFCGGAAVIRNRSCDVGTLWSIACDNEEKCPVLEGCYIENYEKDVAIRNWNSHPVEDKLKRQLAVAKNVIQEVRDNHANPRQHKQRSTTAACEDAQARIEEIDNE